MASDLVDISEFKRKVGAAKQTAPTRRDAVIAGADAFMRRCLLLASEHVDTGRFMHAQAEAGNKAGIGKYPLAPIGPSRIQARLVAILAAQVIFWQKIILIRKKEGRTKDRSFQKLLKHLVQARKVLDDFKEHANAGAIVFNAFGGKRSPSVRINFKEYVGDGSVQTRGGETIVRLHNKTPHASIVEYRFGIIRKSLFAARDFQIRAVTKKKYIDKLRAAGFKAA